MDRIFFKLIYINFIISTLIPNSTVIVWGATKEKTKLQNRASINCVNKKGTLFKCLVKLTWRYSIVIDI